MQRFDSTSPAFTLPHKALEGIADQRFRPSSKGRSELRIAKVLGMDADARTALGSIQALAETTNVAISGRFMPDAGVARKLAALGISENVEQDDFFRFGRIAIPYHGICVKQRRAWEKTGHRVEDLSSARVRRAQVSLGLLHMEGAQPLVIGAHEDDETRAIAGTCGGAIVLEDTTDTARLRFAPAFGVVSQTNMSPRLVSWLVQQLRHRYRDAKVTFLDTISPAMTAREDALERLLVECTCAVIIGDAEETSCKALVETAKRRGCPAAIVANPEEIEPGFLGSGQKVALTAGAFATDEAIRSVAQAIAG